MAKSIQRQNDLTDYQALIISQRILDMIIFTYFCCGQGMILEKQEKSPNTVISGKKFFSYLQREKNPLRALKSLFFDFFTRKHDFNTQILELGEHQFLIPYLSEELLGGAETNKINQIILIERNNFQWKSLFDFFSTYSWVMKAEVLNSDELEGFYGGNITPEVLGEVYEKYIIAFSGLKNSNLDKLALTRKTELKVGNKKIGAYYTPEDLVKFICRKTILPYALEKLELKLGKSCGHYETFLDFYQANYQKKDSILGFQKILSSLTILDPAVGSGRFLICAADILYQWQKTCSPDLDSYLLRKNILTQLYGVDIIEEAIEICKLRLWLWLIAVFPSSNNQTSNSLPSLRFNIQVGNSLVGGVRTVIVRKKQQPWILINDDFQAKLEQYTRLVNAHKVNGTVLPQDLEEIKKTLQEELDKNFLKAIGSIIDYKTLKDLKPFHWIMEFYEIFESGKPDSGFDILLGNPPYGNILSSAEKNIIGELYHSAGANEICANFIERESILLKKGGYLGNVVAGSIVVNKTLSPLRDLLINHFSHLELSYIGTRPAKIFDVEIRVSIAIGKKDYPQSKGTIYTSRAITFTQKQRQGLFDRINHESTEGLLLGSKIGVIPREGKSILPKVGEPIIRDILLKLKEKSTSRIIKDIIQQKGAYSLDFRKTAGYWLNALPKFPYKSTKIVSLKFSLKYERDFVFLLINSNLFYLFWTVYSNLRDVPLFLLQVFPMPDTTILRALKVQINNYAETLERELLKHFDATRGRVGEFNVAYSKPLIDEIEKEVLKPLYGLTSKELSYIQLYEKHIRRALKISPI
ncbi:MAG: Eco57I restriction-modification methylase domain-containing protein [Candidatus Hermodarchaeota archaeon]